jgi:hypothetical protein
MQNMDISVQRQLRLALIAFHDPPEHFVPAMGTMVAGFFIGYPFCCAELPPVGDGAQYDFFADSHVKILNMGTGKFIAFMAPGIAFILCTRSDAALLAMHEQVIGQAAAAMDIVHRKPVAVGERSFAGGSAFVKIEQFFLEFLIVVFMGQADGAHAAVKAAGGNEIRVNGCHGFNPSIK